MKRQQKAEPPCLRACFSRQVKTRAAVYLPALFRVCAMAGNVFADVQAASVQRRPNRCPEPTTLAASLWIWLPSYPLQRNDGRVGGVQSFLISDALPHCEGSNISKFISPGWFSLCGCDRASIGCTASFMHSLNDSPGSRVVLQGYPIVKHDWLSKWWEGHPSPAA